jgi:DNA-binding NarL/FixJ family response regulator
MSAIRVLVVDDHPVVRDGLAAALESHQDIVVVGGAGSIADAVAGAERHRPDILVLDLELPDGDGASAIPRLLQTAPGAGIVVFTAYDTDERVIAAIKAGARGYLLKGAPVEEIVRAIRAVHGGGSHLASGAAAKVVAELAGKRRPRRLTARELDVLSHVAAGLSTKQIARDLGITERTVKFHVASIFNKLGAETRAQAVAQAARRGLL